MAHVMTAVVVKMRHEIKLINVLAISQTSSDPTTELSREIDELLNKLTDKFSSVSTELFAKMDEMATRLDALECMWFSISPLRFYLTCLASLRAVENESAEAKTE